jgi:Leucine-rich repeat (LRR) protein
MVPLNHRDNAVTASYITNKDLLSTHTNNISSTTNREIVINEVMFFPGEGEFEWVELKNIGNNAVDISGWSITDEDDNWYEIPDELPPVPANAFVVIIFDGLGKSLDDYNLGDNTAILHSPTDLVDIFEDNFDQVALYESPNKIFLPLITSNDLQITSKSLERIITNNQLPTHILGLIRAFVAWGGNPLEDGTNAVNSGLWFIGTSVNVYSIGEIPIFAIEPNGSIGLNPGPDSFNYSDFLIFSSDESSHGSENIIPIIRTFHPDDGSKLNGDSFAILWSQVEGTTKYHFQLDDNADFSSPLIDILTDVPYFAPETSVPAGNYFWHVQVISREEESEWSSAKSVSSYIASPITQSSNRFSNPLGVEWQLQHKDTNMLCNGGCKMSGDTAWDIPHDVSKPHATNYCERAAVAMVASYYGSNVTQDRIAYEDYKGTTNELGHNLMNRDIKISLQFIFNFSNEEYYSDVRLGREATFDEIRNFIDQGRPLITLIPGHFRVVDGYRETEDKGQIIEEIHYLDPLIDRIKDGDRGIWESYSAFTEYNMPVYAWVGPAYTPINLFMESDYDNDGTPDVVDDEDGDGLCDFDEWYRFGISFWNDPDSDGDHLTDKKDLIETYFDFKFNGDHSPNPNGPDYDNDGNLKHMEYDNDGDGAYDNCEDSNLNGLYEPLLDETSNFNRFEKRDCIERICEFVTDVQRIECEALLALFDSSNGIDWTNNANWLDSTTVGDWYGVKVDNNHVTELTLKDNHLIGSLPAELGNLFNLKHLNLSYNDLSGNIPKELGDLYSLQHLYLDYNDLSGNIPPELGNLSNLINLDLTGNPLAGSIPPQLGNLKNLDSMTLGYNDLTGSIPSELGDLNNLRYLNLGGNNLSGSIPSELGNLSNLQFLVLSDNDFIGGLPSELGDLFYLITLAVDYNPLSGPIPLSFINMTYLYNFYFYETYLCEPQTAEFLAWKATVDGWWWGNGMICP